MISHLHMELSGRESGDHCSGPFLWKQDARCHEGGGLVLDILRPQVDKLATSRSRIRQGPLSYTGWESAKPKACLIQNPEMHH